MPMAPASARSSTTSARSTGVTNEVGTSWSFGYDAIGRLASKTPPGGYNPTSLSFVQVPE